MIRTYRAFFFALILLGAWPPMADAQELMSMGPESAQPTLTQTAAPVYSQAQLDQMLAPVALYPDPLIAQILMASTYPLEVVEAHRWLQNPQNAALKGDQLAAAIADAPWDPSVKSLVAFPQILNMMDNNLQWT